MDITELLAFSAKQGASDLHLSAGLPPMIRVDGDVRRINVPPMEHKQVHSLIYEIMNDKQRKDFEEFLETDFSFEVPGVARFRVNAFNQNRGAGAVFRTIPSKVLTMEELGMGNVFKDICAVPRGLVLVTGPTGSGKSTTLAAMVDHINRKYPRNIITIEDPIEILHKNQRSLVIQREVGLDTADFSDAVKFAMRQDPDVIMVGEMRDKDTVEAALTAAQTGHLVLSTLHTLDAVRTVNRIIDFFPPHERDQIRILLAESLLGILSQRLLPRADGPGRMLALEVLVNTPLIRDYIKDADKTPLIKEALEDDNIRGMQTFDQHLVELYLDGHIAMDAAVAMATSPHEFKLMVTQQQGGSRPGESGLSKSGFGQF